MSEKQLALEDFEKDIRHFRVIAALWRTTGRLAIARHFEEAAEALRLAVVLMKEEPDA